MRKMSKGEGKKRDVKRNDKRRKGRDEMKRREEDARRRGKSERKRKN